MDIGSCVHLPAAAPGFAVAQSGAFTVSTFDACAGFTLAGLLSLRLNAVSRWTAHQNEWQVLEQEVDQLKRREGWRRHRAQPPQGEKLTLFKLLCHFSVGQAWTSTAVTVVVRVGFSSLLKFPTTPTVAALRGFKVDWTLPAAMMPFDRHAFICRVQRIRRWP